VKGLLDTHVLLWTADDPSQLSAAAAAFIGNPSNQRLVSVVSAWEIVIKVNTGKLRLTIPVRDLRDGWTGSGGGILDVRLDHALAVEGLPTAHKDPFDRILAAQAIAERAVLLTTDKVFRHYPVTVVW
jgi:PIN domain nuclease of toxin-antitoxin system